MLALNGTTAMRYVRDQYTLVLPLLTHVNPSSLSNGEYMRWILISALPSILLDNGIRI